MVNCSDALTAYGALFVVAKTIRAECADKVLLVLAAWLVAVFSVLILWSLIESMATFRGRIAWVYASYFRSEKKKGLPVGEPKSFFNTVGYIWGLMVVSLLGVVIATIAILRV